MCCSECTLRFSGEIYFGSCPTNITPTLGEVHIKLWLNVGKTGIHTDLIMVYIHISLWYTCTSHYGIHRNLFMVYIHISLWYTYTSHYGIHTYLIMVYIQISLWYTYTSLYGIHTYVADHSPHLVPRSRMSRIYTSSPPSATMACSGTALLLHLSKK
jgi:hypothetical protein